MRQTCKCPPAAFPLPVHPLVLSLSCFATSKLFNSNWCFLRINPILQTFQALLQEQLKCSEPQRPESEAGFDATSHFNMFSGKWSLNLFEQQDIIFKRVQGWEYIISPFWGVILSKHDPEGSFFYSLLRVQALSSHHIIFITSSCALNLLCFMTIKFTNEGQKHCHLRTFLELK